MMAQSRFLGKWGRLCASLCPEREDREMARCLDCGFLYLARDKKEEREYTQAERKELLEEPQLLGGPRSLGCFRGADDFPGNALPRVSSYSEPPPLPARISKQLIEDDELIDLLEQEWNCALFTPHVPGLKPSGHLALQQSRELIERQERFAAEQGRLNRRIAYSALIVSIVAILVSLR